MRRRFRRRRSRWVWADNGAQTTAEGLTPLLLSAYAPVIPPNRVDWILSNEARGRNVLTVDRVLLWIYVTYTNTVAAPFPGLDIGICKFRAGSAGSGGADTVPFQAPVAPGAAGTTWYGSGSVEESDGLDPYLFSGHIPSTDQPFDATTLTRGVTFPAPVGRADYTLGVAGTYVADSAFGWGSFRPVIDLKVKRRLTREEGLIFFASTNSIKSETESLECSWHVRVLAH